MADKAKPLYPHPDDGQSRTDDETRLMSAIDSADGPGIASESDLEGGVRPDNDSSAAASMRPDRARNGNYDFPTAEKPIIDDEALSRPRRYQAGVVSGAPAPAFSSSRRLSESLSESAAPHRRFWDVRTLIFALVVVCGLAAAVVFVLPGATVTLIPRSDIVSRDVTFTVVPGPAASGAKEAGPPLISAAPVETVLTMEGSTEVKGSLVIPESTAEGAVTLRNASFVPVFVPSGTALGPAGETWYFTVEDIDVPAADPFGAGTFGSADVRIIAGVAGSRGNLSPGGLQGQLSNGLYFFNNSSLAGGSERRVSLVSDGDQRGLRTELESRLRGEGPGELKAKLERNQELVGPLVSYEDWQAKFDHSVGEEATSLKLTLVVKVHGYAYRSPDVEKEMRRALTNDPSSIEGLRAALALNSVRYDQPEVVKTDALQVTYHTKVTAERTYQLDQITARAVQSSLAGKSKSEVEQYLKGLTAVKSFRIERSLDWFAKEGMPQFQWRITVRNTSR